MALIRVSSMAASVDTVLEAHQWGLSSYEDSKTDDLIRVAGYGIDAVEMAYMQGPKPWTFMYQGSAKNVRAELSG